MFSQENISHIKKIVDDAISQKFKKVETKISSLHKDLIKFKDAFDDHLQNTQCSEATDAKLQESVQHVLCEMQNTVLKDLIHNILIDIGDTSKPNRLESTPNMRPSPGEARVKKCDELNESFVDLQYRDGKQINTLEEALWEANDDDDYKTCYFNNENYSPTSDYGNSSGNKGEQQYKLEKSSHILSPDNPSNLIKSSQLSTSPAGYELHQTAMQASGCPKSEIQKPLKSRFPIPNDVIAESPKSLDGAMEIDNTEKKETVVQDQNTSEASKEMLSLESQAAFETNAVRKDTPNFESLSYESMLGQKTNQKQTPQLASKQERELMSIEGAIDSEQQTSQRINPELANKLESGPMSIEAAIDSDNDESRGHADEISADPKSLENQIEKDQETASSSKKTEALDKKSSAQENQQTSTDVAAIGDPPEEKTKTDESSQQKQSSKSKFGIHVPKMFGGKGKSKHDKS